MAFERQMFMDVMAEFEKAQLFVILGKLARRHGALVDGECAELAAAWAVTVVLKLREAAKKVGEGSEVMRARPH